MQRRRPAIPCRQLLITTQRSSRSFVAVNPNLFFSPGQGQHCRSPFRRIAHRTTHVRRRFGWRQPACRISYFLFSVVSAQTSSAIEFSARNIPHFYSFSSLFSTARTFLDNFSFPSRSIKVPSTLPPNSQGSLPFPSLFPSQLSAFPALNLPSIS